MLKAVWVIGLLAVAQCVEFHMFEGKTADPCNKFLDPFVRKDCPKHSQWPAPSVTVLIPSETSGGITKVPSGQALYDRMLTITGHGFPVVPAGTSNSWLGLADTRDSCQYIDPTLQFANARVNSFIPNEMTFNIRPLWASLSLELEDRPRLLCWTPFDPNDAAAPNTWRYTGWKIGTVWNCDDTDNTNIDNNAKCGSDVVRTLSANWRIMNLAQREERIKRTKCCKGRIPGTIAAGQCINPNVQACCGGAAYEIHNEKCCNVDKEWVAQIDGNCPCNKTAQCPVGEKCCVPTKYGELNFNADIAPYFPAYRGQCYRPTRQSCCNTGSVYDPGSHQCCVINGVQSMNIPCPCNKDLDCAGGQYPTSSRTTNHTCCRQTAPAPWEVDQFPDTETGLPTALADSNAHCSIYANYPTGEGSYKVQRCKGSCMDPNYQICCNGATCMKEYELCCNSTCCNRWTSTCFNALRPGTIGSPHNFINFGAQTDPTEYYQCSSVEALNTVKGFWVFVWPAILLLGSHIGLALVMVFATKATPRRFSKIEYSMMGFALLVAYLAMPFFFAPIWKYGVWVIGAQLLVFLTASARIRWLNVVCVFIQFITLVYLFDPFHGNAWLTLSLNRQYNFVNAPDDTMTSGILHSISKNWHTVDMTAVQQYCTKFYDYFMYDPMMRDLERYDNGMIATFGYCSRGWNTALMIFSYFVMSGVLIQLVLSLVALFFRFRMKEWLGRVPAY